MESSQEQAETKLESQTEKFGLRRNAFILEHLLEEAVLHWKETKNELEGVLPAEEMKRDKRSPEFIAFKIELMQDKAKVECLLEQMESVKDEGNLGSQRWKMRLSENMGKAEFVLQEMKSMLEEGLGASGLEVHLIEQIVKSELLLEEMVLAGVVEKVEFAERFTVVVKYPVLKMQLKKHIVKVESLLKNMKFVHEESKDDTVEFENLLREMKLAQESGKVKSSLSRLMLEAYVVKLKLLLDETEIGGRDGNEERNSEKIYEILLAPPYTFNVLETLGTPVAWHGAELVGYDIFIFGGEGRSRFVPTSNVFAYNLVREELRPMQCLPCAVMGMATVTKGKSVAVVGGLDGNEQDLDKV